MTFNNFITRTLVGALYIALIVISLYLGSVSFGLFCTLVLYFSMDEFFKMVKRLKINTPESWASIAAVIVFVMVILFKNDVIGMNVLMLSPMIFIIFMINELMSTNRNPLTNLAVTVFGFIYILFPIVSLYLIGFYNRFSWTDEFSHEILLGFFILVWASDTGAYLAGSAFGRTKLFERISPKKTVEGSVGGLLLTMAIAYLLSNFIQQISVLDWIVIAILVVIFGTYGDLFESLLKRKAEIKDSGKLIPGHGGMLDRFDSILFAAPVVFVYLHLVGH